LFSVTPSYKFITNAFGNSKEELEQSARTEAEEYFGTPDLTFERAAVSPSEKEGLRYQGTFSYSVADRHPGLS
jgi:hypothetical protein